MTSPIARHQLSLDTPDRPQPDTAMVYLPSADLLDRAEAGFERFAALLGEGTSDG
ncbi:hypothetical protein ACFWCB_26430 [Streptomyces sp. NPDC060048]|uniref:hypothetical protein n=1 Tax=unclassified Streptomyces TaxID=2593676 RepID=UPI0036A831D9